MSLWFPIRQDLNPGRHRLFGVFAFLLPLAVWSLFSYVPWLWHPMVRVTDPAGVSWIKTGQILPREDFAKLVEKQAALPGALPSGIPANPLYFPPPHAVGRALYTAFTTEPVLKGDKWLHEAILSSIGTIFWGFTLACLLGVPLGVFCGASPAIARLTEPFVDFVRYMPAPAFGALMVAIFGIHVAPKISVIFIGVFFPLVLVVATTVRRADASLVEAAQTLGAKRRALVFRVLVPASLPDLYNDLRLLLGSAWTYLIVAEVVGVSSGISFFINQQAKYRNFDNVYAAIVIIGAIGFSTDQALAWIGQRLFAWKNPRPSRLRRWLGRLNRAPTVPARGKIPALSESP